MRTERKVYTEEFKRDAVRLAKERGNTLQGWKLQLDKTPDNPFPGNGNLRDADFAQLQRENACLREENEILKRQWASSLFARSKIPVHPTTPWAVSRCGFISGPASLTQRVRRLA